MRNIRNRLFELRLLITGKSTLDEKDVMELIESLSYIHIESDRGEITK